MSWAAILKPIASALFETVVDWFKDWYQQEKREAAEWAAKSRERQMESLKEGRQLETEMRVARDAAVATSSVAEWNKKAKARNERNRALGLVALLMCSVCLSGCFRFYVSAREYKPYLPLPKQPTLSEAAPMDNQDFQKVLQYVAELEAVVDTYNEKARLSNFENGFEAEAPKKEEAVEEPSTPTP